jgi:magnesium chelatase family protein
MLAEAFASLLPPPSENEILEIMEVWSAAGEKFERYARPFRSPHHTASPSAILGGGTNPRPGEISLAHRGVLFLDELPEFRRDVLEGLRQPLENGTVCVARSKKSLEFPARFIFVAAMNPCPCGFFGDKEKECRCTAYEVLKYQKRVSGPLLDRIDLQLFVPRVPYEALAERRENREMKLRDRIFRAREFQQTRLRSLGISGESNAEIGAKDIEAIAELEPAGEAFLKSAMEKSFVSPRSYHKILKVARTIADLDGAETIGTPHLAEAFHYRLRAGEV